MNDGVRILVTGATGLLGNNVVRCLLGHGHSLRVLVRPSASLAPIAGLNVDVVQGDVRCRTDVEQAIDGVTHVVHAAGSVAIGWLLTPEIVAANVDGTANVAAAARAHRARLVHVSTVNTLALGTANAAANELSPHTQQELACNYIVSKRRGEDAVLTEQKRGLSAAIVHPGFMLGPWDWKPSSGTMFLAVARRASPFFPRGGCSVCDARDVAEGIRRVLMADQTNNCQYIFAGHNVTYAHLWREMATVAGVRPPRWPMGPLVSAVSGWAGDLWGRCRRCEPLVNSAAVAMGNQFHYYDSHRAQREFGYATRPLQQTLIDTWRWLQRYHTR